MKTIVYSVNPDGTTTPTSVTDSMEMLDSVELSIGAKGDVKPVVKVYRESVEEASLEAQRIIDDLVKKYNITLGVK